MSGSAGQTLTAKSLGSEVSRLSLLQEARWKVTSDYVKPAVTRRAD